MSGMARVLLVVVSVLALGWLAIRERDTRLLARGSAKALAATTPRLARQAEADLRAARFLNPDAYPDLYRAILYESRGRLGEATRLALGVTRREPDDVQAWGVVYRLALRTHDRALAARAFREFRRLNPHYGAPA